MPEGRKNRYMANFHTNYFVIAANEEDMCKVLVRMAMNLAANKEYTGFDLADIEGLTTARDIYYQVRPAIDSSYIYAFAGAPILESVEAGEDLGWTSPTSSKGGFMMQLAAMAQAMEQLNTGWDKHKHVDNGANCARHERLGVSGIRQIW